MIQHLSLLKETVSCYDTDLFAFLTPSKREDGLLSSYPLPWIERYFAENYEVHDLPLQSKTEPIFWGFFPSRSLTKIQQQIFDEAKEFDIVKGITVPMAVLSEHANFTIAFDEHYALSTKALYELVPELTSLAHLFAIYRTMEAFPEAPGMDHLLNELASWIKNQHFRRGLQNEKLSQILIDFQRSKLLQDTHDHAQAVERVFRTTKNLEELLN